MVSCDVKRWPVDASWVPESQVRARRASLTHFVLASASVDGSHGQKNARFINHPWSSEVIDRV